MAEITGGCLCGQVRYTITGEPAVSVICHCRDCQHFTGSAFAAGLVFPTSSVKIQGDIKTFDVVGGSGKAAHRYFCPNCGSGIGGAVDVSPGNMIVVAGSLDDPNAFVPKLELYCDSAQPWVHAESERQRLPTGRHGKG
jgi:hypothetical protein